MADRVEGLREIEGYDDDIWVGLEQTSDGMEKGDDGSRRGTSRTESKLIGEGETGWRCQESWIEDNNLSPSAMSAHHTPSN